MLDDVEQASAGAGEAGCDRWWPEIAVESVKEPQRGVGGVVESFALALGEHVGNESVADIVGEGPQDIARLDVPAGGQGQAFEADHGVAAPVGEPVIAGDDRADFIARRPGPGRFLDAALRR